MSHPIQGCKTYKFVNAPNHRIVFSNLEGDIYMESVCCSVNIAHLTFHAMMFREIWGKLGMICVAGQPNMSKTKEVLCALHMASSLQYFYGMKVKKSSIFKHTNFDTKKLHTVSK